VVSVIINGIHPYQKAIPAGNGSNNGTKDYRLWKFTDNPSYVTIKPGLNKITAKYSCFPMSDLSNKKQQRLFASLTMLVWQSQQNCGFVSG
jgi:hypothetical protein